jgi:AraC family transcriptional regulator of adaptative response/methylated-DNA-[protein]-cysteine methyltransferase
MTSHDPSPARRRFRAPSQLALGFERGSSTAAEGFESVAALREAFSRAFNEPVEPGQREGAIHVGWVETPIGPMIAGSHQEALILLEFSTRLRMEAQIEALRKRFKTSFVLGDDAIITQTRRELDEYFAGRRREFTMPLQYPGTPFEERVWTALLKIPYGETCSYEELALITSSKGAVRAVGSANGRNRIAIIIPCHRVVNKSGALGGYGGGLWRKETLLRLEHGA